MKKMKKFSLMVVIFLLNCTIHASTFQLLSVEKEEQESDSPTTTTYTYTSAVPLIVSYRYGFNIDRNSYELAIKFADTDVANTQLRSVYFDVSDEDQQFLKKLKITDFKPEQGCYYYAKAELEIDEVWVATFEFGGSDYGIAHLKYIKSPDDAPHLECT